MADHILYSSSALEEALEEVSQLSDALGDARQRLSGIDTSRDWWREMRILVDGSRATALAVLDEIRGSMMRINSDVEELQAAMNRVIRLFDAAETEVKNYSDQEPEIVTIGHFGDVKPAVVRYSRTEPEIYTAAVKPRDVSYCEPALRDVPYTESEPELV